MNQIRPRMVVDLLSLFEAVLVRQQALHPPSNDTQPSSKRYKLLLEGMLKNTERDHPDRPLLQNAIEQISDVASFINDSIKRRENQAKIWGTRP